MCHYCCINIVDIRTLLVNILIDIYHYNINIWNIHLIKNTTNIIHGMTNSTESSKFKCLQNWVTYKIKIWCFDIKASSSVNLRIN